jgi:hypothetical protein
VAGGGRVRQLLFKTGMLLCDLCDCALLVDRFAVLSMCRDNFVISSMVCRAELCFLLQLSGRSTLSRNFEHGRKHLWLG